MDDMTHFDCLGKNVGSLKRLILVSLLPPKNTLTKAYGFSLIPVIYENYRQRKYEP